jgi:hypothetical protein
MNAKALRMRVVRDEVPLLQTLVWALRFSIPLNIKSIFLCFYNSSPETFFLLCKNLWSRVKYSYCPAQYVGHRVLYLLQKLSLSFKTVSMYNTWLHSHLISIVANAQIVLRANTLHLYTELSQFAAARKPIIMTENVRGLLPSLQRVPLNRSRLYSNICIYNTRIVSVYAEYTG